MWQIFSFFQILIQKIFLMSCQLHADCLNEIFEYLEGDKINLRSCLLVNRLWCRIGVGILWRNIWSFRYSIHYRPYRTHVPLSIFNTLIACLPSESKDLLRGNGIVTLTLPCRPAWCNHHKDFYDMKSLDWNKERNRWIALWAFDDKDGSKLRWKPHKGIDHQFLGPFLSITC